MWYIVAILVGFLIGRYWPRQREARCAFCDKKVESKEEIRTHIVNCEKHPIQWTYGACHNVFNDFSEQEIKQLPPSIQSIWHIGRHVNARKSMDS